MTFKNIKEAEDIDSNYPELKELIQNMFETNERADGVGLAAPQIGLPIRVVIVDLRPLAEDYPEYVDFKRAYINGYIVEEDGETLLMDEGCLSLPGIHEKVPRAERVHIQYVDEDFVEHDEWVEGFLARVIQHEFDHLEGKVFTDRISPLRRQMNKGKFNALLSGKVRCDYKVKVAKK
jgi:peptide deformylase